VIIYPTIELKDGKCTIFRRGRVEDPRIFDIKPQDAARRFAEAGAEWLHITDLDGVMQGGRHNADIITDIIENVGIPVQVAGGIRTIDAVHWWMEHGAARVVLGTAAVKDRHLVQEACTLYPDKVVIAIYSSGNAAVIEGLTEVTAFKPLDLARELEKSGPAAIMITDMDMNDALPDASFALTAEIAQELEIPVISSGCVNSLDDVSILKQLPKVAGAVIGRALFNDKVSLEEAIAIGNMPFTRAKFT
jgi:phosphoribosylformimino-5-aminoimidazole carboxamide ribotide isomerase